MGHHMHRHVRIHAIDRRPRSSLDQTKHPSIDSILNDIKPCIRSLQALLKAHLEEARLLERLYYKGKNQHRGALFWRHVAEMRRFCSRVEDAQIDVLLDTFYRSFFDEKFGIGPKSPKGAWTHYPNTAFVVFVLARLSACSDLLAKMHLRAMNAYQSFTLVMKTGIFLQLVLTLAAIASRLRNVSLELQHALVNATTSAQRALTIINYEETPPRFGSAEYINPSLSCLDSLPLFSAGIEPPNPILVDVAVPSECPQLPSAQVVIEYKATRPPNNVKPRRNFQKRREPKMKDEIDDIFGM